MFVFEKLFPNTISTFSLGRFSVLMTSSIKFAPARLQNATKTCSRSRNTYVINSYKKETTITFETLQLLSDFFRARKARKHQPENARERIAPNGVCI